MQQNLTSTASPQNDVMALQKIELEETDCFSPIFLDYVKGAPELEEFYGARPTLESFKAQIDTKSNFFSEETRTVLASSIKRQYKDLHLSPLFEQHLERLRSDKTFTVTTGHQLNIFTGPLYFIYKIVTVINTCKVLKTTYPEYNFIPMYWMASEDHDFEEISYFNLFGKRHTWETSQKGAVGRFSTEGLQTILEELPEGTRFFENAYKEQPNLAAAVRAYVHHLFSEEGLVVLDADDADLKGLFRQVMREDTDLHSAKKAVERASSLLDDIGYKTQVHPREINFFYLDKGIRSRIEKKGELYRVVDSPLEFTRAELLDIIENEPEKLSPNVVLRPLYQEMILPNLGYIGGPGELAYWLQLKGVFEAHGTPFPILMPRNFAMILGRSLNKKFKKTGMSIQDLFLEKDLLVKRYVQENTENELRLDEEKVALSKVFDDIIEKGSGIDPTLRKMMEAQRQRALNSVEDIEKRLLKAEKRNHETQLNQVETLKDALFPDSSLQERTDNFLNFYLNDPNFINLLLKSFSPFDFRFNVLLEN